MAATNNLIPDFDDFERYRSGEMPSDEQRSLEGRMLAEPLVAEAYEGFLAWRAQRTDAAGVQADLRERLRTRVTPVRRNALPLWAYASAASVLLALFAYWSVFWDNQKAGMQESSAAETQETATSSAPEQAPVLATIQPDGPSESIASAPAEPKPSFPAAPVPATPPLQLAEGKARLDIASAAPQNFDGEIQEEAVVSVLADSLRSEKDSVKAAPQVAGVLAAPGSAQAVGKSMEARVRMQPSSLHTVAKGSLDSDTQRVATEMTSVRPGIAGKKSFNSITLPADTPTPVPADGWPAYRAYLEKNTGSSSTNGQIVVTFIVSPSGTLSGLVAKGPKELQKEAIRIVSNGPAWLPARTKGGMVASRAEVNLQFRQSQ